MRGIDCRFAAATKTSSVRWYQRRVRCDSIKDEFGAIVSKFGCARLGALVSKALLTAALSDWATKRAGTGQGEHVAKARAGGEEKKARGGDEKKGGASAKRR